MNVFAEIAKQGLRLGVDQGDSSCSLPVCWGAEEKLRFECIWLRSLLEHTRGLDFLLDKGGSTLAAPEGV